MIKIIKRLINFYSKENRLKRRIESLRVRILELQQLIEFYEFSDYILDDSLETLINKDLKLRTRLRRYEDMYKNI